MQDSVTVPRDLMDKLLTAAVWCDPAEFGGWEQLEKELRVLLGVPDTTPVHQLNAEQSAAFCKLLGGEQS